MRTIEVPDEVYEELERAAVGEGLSVEAYVSTLVVNEKSPEEFTRLFTPERIADWNRVADEMANGEKFSVDEVWTGLEEHKAAQRATASQ